MASLYPKKEKHPAIDKACIYDLQSKLIDELAHEVEVTILSAKDGFLLTARNRSIVRIELMKNGRFKLTVIPRLNGIRTPQQSKPITYYDNEPMIGHRWLINDIRTATNYYLLRM